MPALTDFMKGSYGEYIDTARKMKFSTKDFFIKWDKIRRKLLIWSYLLKKSLVENFIFFVVIDFHSFFEKLLRRGNSTTLHQRNLQKLITEIFKVKTRIAPELG